MKKIFIIFIAISSLTLFSCRDFLKSINEKKMETGKWDSTEFDKSKFGE